MVRAEKDYREFAHSREDENPSLLFLVLSPHLVPSRSYEPRTKLLAPERRTALWSSEARTWTRSVGTRNLGATRRNRSSDTIGER
ncbi:hypothetical protein V512_004765 [Mesotoga sp. Brook.08.105.5.1]|nr:hypothetical protein RM69_04100 [Mesotoga sp. SC_NapDC3]PVD16245.1 hypothetical protein V512_004765 [Mesotoga sp. Brook.08.105.5.1]PXF33324.1 hypothetical protein EU77_14370 [Mesotoga sp. SC_NapDC]